MEETLFKKREGKESSFPLSSSPLCAHKKHNPIPISHQPKGQKKLPILISIPHCGSTIPPELKKQLSKKAGEEVEDTDWFVEKLYAFAPGDWHRYSPRKL